LRISDTLHIPKLINEHLRGWNSKPVTLAQYEDNLKRVINVLGAIGYRSQVTFSATNQHNQYLIRGISVVESSLDLMERLQRGDWLAFEHILLFLYRRIHDSSFELVECNTAALDDDSVNGEITIPSDFSSIYINSDRSDPASTVADIGSILTVPLPVTFESPLLPLTAGAFPTVVNPLDNRHDLTFDILPLYHVGSDLF
jgi:hypothetical protein